MNQIYLGLAIHNHQPLGNFPWVFKDAFDHAYRPMLEALERHPEISMSLHFSGCLIDWLKLNQPWFFTALSNLINRGQVEIIGGGYYEPILPAIPDADKLGQIDKLSIFLEKEFGKRPEGMWLAERVWEPYLAKILTEAGVEWTLIDDTAFKMIGMDDKDLFSYFLTEEQGKNIKVFPISKYLRYAIPWHKTCRIIEYLKQEASQYDGKIVVLGDDGEKFGIWPETYKHCWEDGWVEEFFQALSDNSDWLKTIKLGSFAASFPAAGRVYLPCAAYDEMMEWSLPADKSRSISELKHKLKEGSNTELLQFLYAGFWRNFLTKYPEINRMYKKMLYVHDKVYSAKERSKADCGLDDLWKAQCNCPYWHGVFGGIYLSDIRATAYSNLICAENKADKVLNKKDRTLGCREIDYDGDGKKEILVEGNLFNLYLSAAEGGSILEWDLRRHAYNLLSSVSRKKEAYHIALSENELHGASESNKNEIASIHEIIRVKDDDITKFLIYDSIPRSSLLDRFINKGLNLEEFEAGHYKELGDFVGRAYESRIEKCGTGKTIVFQRLGEVSSDIKQSKLAIEKSVVIYEREEKIDINYKFANGGNNSIDVRFGSEWNINLLGGGHNEKAYYSIPCRVLNDSHLDSHGEVENIKQLFMGNSQLGIEIKLEMDRPVTIWRYPVESVSNSEGGIERIYQCSCLIILLPLCLEPGEKAGLSYSWNVTK